MFTKSLLSSQMTSKSGAQRIEGSMKNKIVNSDLQEERDKKNFDEKDLQLNFMAGEESFREME